MNAEITRTDLFRMLCTNHYESNECVNVFSDITLEFSTSSQVYNCGCYYGKMNIVYIISMLSNTE